MRGKGSPREKKRRTTNYYSVSYREIPPPPLLSLLLAATRNRCSGYAEAMPRTAKRTPEKDWKPAFLKELCQCGNVSLSANKAKVGRRTVYQARESDPAFAEAWEEAIEISTEYLEGEARRRAYNGVLEPVFHIGKKVGTVRKYSDTLLIFLLKAHKPKKYRDRHSVEHSGPDGKAVEHKGTYEHRQQLPDAAAVAEFLRDLGLPCPGNVPGNGGEESMDRGSGV